MNRNSRSFLILLQGQFVTNLGNQIYDMAMLLWVKELTGSAALMGLAMLMTDLPAALLAPLGGKISDRFGQVRTMVVADLISAMAVGLVLLTMWSVASASDPSLLILALCFGNLLLGLSASCFDPSVLALVPSLVPSDKLERGNAAHQFSRMGGRVVGQGAGGLLFAALGAAGAFIVNALSFLVSAFTEMWINAPRRVPSPEEGSGGASLLRQTGDMFRRILGEPGLRLLLVTIAAFHLCLSCLPVLLPFYAEHILRISDKWFGLFVAAYTVGIMLGFIVSGMLKPSCSRFRLIASVSAVVGVLFGAAAVTSSFFLAWVVMLAIGAGIGVIIVNVMTELQLSSPEEERGGVMGVAQAVGGTSFPLGMALTGVLMDVMHSRGMSYVFCIRTILALSAASSVLIAVNALSRKREAP